MIHLLAIKPDEPGFDLTIGICFGVGLLLLIGVFWAARKHDQEVSARKQAHRGFEVKLTDPSSVTEKKENDHG